MPLDPKQERYLNRFYPGLIEAVAALGAGEFVAKAPTMHAANADCIKFIKLDLKYRIHDGHEVDIRSQLRLRNGRPPYKPSDVPANLAHWQQIRYSLHYGRTFEDCDFRFDLDELSGHHVHMRPDPHDHVDCDNVDPDTRHMPPATFVAMVATYRQTGVYPVKKKRP